MYILSENFLTLRSIQQNSITSVHRSSPTVPVILVRFVIKLEFFDRFFEK